MKFIFAWCGTLEFNSFSEKDVYFDLILVYWKLDTVWYWL